MSGAVAKVSKPVIRGFLHNQIKRNLVVGCTLSVTAGLLMYFGVNEPTKRAYAEFYSTYDIEKDFQRMKKAGLFESCGPSD